MDKLCLVLFLQIIFVSRPVILVLFVTMDKLCLLYGVLDTNYFCNYSLAQVLQNWEAGLH